MIKHLSIKIWERVAEFRIEEPELQEEELWCGYAREFYEWIDEWIIPVEFELISINQARVLLLNKYMEWRSFVPKSHQDYTGSRGHTCIYHAFIRACEHLQVMELRLHKPILLPDPEPQSNLKFPGAALFLPELDSDIGEFLDEDPDKVLDE